MDHHSHSAHGSRHQNDQNVPKQQTQKHQHQHQPKSEHKHEPRHEHKHEQKHELQLQNQSLLCTKIEDAKGHVQEVTIPKIKGSVVNEDVTIDTKNWMGNLPNNLIHTPLIYLAIPGSHNSFSYSIRRSSAISSDCPKTGQYFCQQRVWGAIARKIIYKWSKGQKLDVWNQLQLGIRFFDIRLFFKDNEIFIAHGMCGSPIQLFLYDINSFLDSNPKEVVILDFQHFYDFPPGGHDIMKLMLLNIFTDKICIRNRKMIDNTLNLFWQNKTQVLIIYRNNITSTTNLFWPSGTWTTHWPAKIKIRDLIDYLNKGLSLKSAGVGHVSQAILTPTPKYIFLHPFGSLRKLAQKVNKNVITWLEPQCSGINGVNVVICDYVEQFNFSEMVILLNYKPPAAT